MVMEIILLTDDEGHYVGVGAIHGEYCCVEWCGSVYRSLTVGRTKELFDEKLYWREDPHHILRGMKLELLNEEIENGIKLEDGELIRVVTRE